MRLTQVCLYQGKHFNVVFIILDNMLLCCTCRQKTLHSVRGFSVAWNRRPTVLEDTLRLWRWPCTTSTASYMLTLVSNYSHGRILQSCTEPNAFFFGRTLHEHCSLLQSCEFSHISVTQKTCLLVMNFFQMHKILSETALLTVCLGDLAMTSVNYK